MSTHTPNQADDLRKLIARATDDDLVEDGRYFHDSCQDLTQCYHGDGGRFDNADDGKLVAFLWNNRLAICDALSAVNSHKDLVEALEEVRKVRDGYASQAKFCDIEALGYFREFIRRIDAALSKYQDGGEDK